MDTDQKDCRGFSFRLPLLTVLLSAFALRLYNLEANPLWFDEAMEYWVATAAPADLLPAVQQALQDPPLYSALLHLWQSLGHDEFTLRYLSLLVSVLSVAALFALGTRLGGWTLGAIAAALLAILPPGIRFAQEVGQYAPAVCALTINLLALHRAATTNGRRDWLIWGITAVIAAYTYFGTLLILVPTAAVTFIILLRQQRSAAKRLLGMAAISLLLFAPLALLWLPGQLFRGPTSSAFQTQLSSASAELSMLLSRTQGMLAYQLTGFLAQPLAWQVRLQQVAAVLLLLLLAIGFLFALRQRQTPGLALRWLALCTVASWLAYYAAGRLGVYPYGGTRHALILSPLLLAMAAVGLQTLWRWQKLVGVAVFLAIAAVALLAPPEPPEALRTVTDYWLSQRHDDTPTYIYYGAVPGFRYQLQLAQESPQTATDPLLPLWYVHCWEGRPALYCNDGKLVYGRWIRSHPPAEKRAAILNAFNPLPDAFWLIVSHTSEAEQKEVLQALAADYIVADQFRATGAAVYLLSR